MWSLDALARPIASGDASGECCDRLGVDCAGWGSTMTAEEPTSLSFEQAILPHLDAAYNLARWLARDPATADDIVQDACLRALQYFASFRGDDGRAWLLQIVRNATYAKLKTRRSGVEVAFDAMSDDEHGTVMEIPDPGPGPEATYARREDLAQLDAALTALPVELRECLVLCELEQLSYKQIAHITGVPIGTVMSRLWRARRLLTRSPGGEGGR